MACNSNIPLIFVYYQSIVVLFGCSVLEAYTYLAVIEHLSTYNSVHFTERKNPDGTPLNEPYSRKRVS